MFNKYDLVAHDSIGSTNIQMLVNQFCSVQQHKCEYLSVMI